MHMLAPKTYNVKPIMGCHAQVARVNAQQSHTGMELIVVNLRQLRQNSNNN